MLRAMISFQEVRQAERARGVLPITVRGKLTPDGWIDHIREGGAVILDISDIGLRISTDAVHEIGQIVRIAVPDGDPTGGEVTVEARVVWARRNDVVRFGRWSCGLAFSPAVQPGIPILRSAHWARNRKPDHPGAAAA